MICCLPGSSPSRHFERREDPGDEVGLEAVHMYISRGGSGKDTKPCSFLLQATERLEFIYVNSFNLINV